MTSEDTKQIARLKSVYKWNTNLSVLNQIEAIESKYKLKDIPFKGVSKKIQLQKYDKFTYTQCDEVKQIFRELKMNWTHYKETKNRKYLNTIKDLQSELKIYRIQNTA